MATRGRILLAAAWPTGARSLIGLPQATRPGQQAPRRWDSQSDGGAVGGHVACFLSSAGARGTLPGHDEEKCRS